MKPDGALRASEWSVEVIPFDVARSLVLHHHYSRSTGNTATERHGLLDAAGVAVGAAIWIPPTKSAAQATLKRLGRDPSGWRGCSVSLASPSPPRPRRTLPPSYWVDP